MAKKKVGYIVDEVLVARFASYAELNNVTPSQFIHAAMNSFVSGDVVVVGNNLQSTGAPRETYQEKRPVGRPAVKKEEEPVAKPTKMGARDADGKIISWFDLDHSKRELKDFDYPDNIHPDVETRKPLDIDWSREELSGSVENMIRDEYCYFAREKVSEREWDTSVYWDFCRWCAKKFLTLNRVTDIYYDQEYLMAELIRLKNLFDADYAFDAKCQEEYDARQS